MEKPKTIREVKEFLNNLDEKYLERIFYVQQENDVHHVHYLNTSNEDLYYDSDDSESGSMSLKDWKEFLPDTPKESLKIGIPKGAPMIAEDF